MDDTKPSKPEIAIIGAEYLHQIVSHGSEEYDNCIIRVEHTGNLKHHELQEWGIVVLPYRMYLNITKLHRVTGHVQCEAPLTNIVELEQQITTALQKGRSVCFLVESLVGCPYPYDTLVKIDDVYKFLDDDDEKLKSNIIGHRILRNIGAYPHLAKELTSNHQVKRGEFKNYLHNFGAGSIWFEEIGDSVEADIICSNAEGEPTGFCLQVGKGNLLFLPYLRHERLDFDEAMKSLASGIITYLSRIAGEEPEWAQSFVFAQEKPLIVKRQKVEAEIRGLDSQLAYFKNLRAVLWQRDYALQESVPHFLKELGIETRQDETFEEDFWVTKDGKDIVIGEVKSMNGNISRQDIGKLDEHRKARGKPNSFPALLIANTFATMQGLQEKDKRVEPNVCKRAVDDHIIAMRTIDLFHLFDCITQGQLAVSEFIDVLLTESGWLLIDSSGLKIIKK